MVATMRPGCRSRPWCSVLLVLLRAGGGAATSSKSDDPSISTRVKIALLNEPRIGGYRIDETTLHGVVTLSGAVPAQADADQAVAAAKRAPGVKDVKSELKVGGS